MLIINTTDEEQAIYRGASEPIKPTVYTIDQRCVNRPTAKPNNKKTPVANALLNQKGKNVNPPSAG